MKFLEWLGFSSADEDTKKHYREIYLAHTSLELHFKLLAINSSINLIANAMLKARFKTYENGQIKKANTHYMFNVQPNKNQNASEFIHQFVSNLVYNNEVLAVMQDDEIFIADSWEQVKFALKPNLYRKVTINDFSFDKVFNETEVFHFRLNNEKMSKIIDSLYGSYGKLLGVSMSSYRKKNSKKYFLELDTLIAQTDDDMDELVSALGEQFRKFFSSDGDSMWPIQKGTALNPADASSSSSKIDSRDIRALVDDVFDFVAMAFNIPKGLLKGDVADVEAMTSNFLMFCVNPIAELMKDEINRKMFTKEEYLNGTRLDIDTRFIKITDINQVATAVDKLFMTGTHNIDENRDLLGEEPLNEEFSKQYYITKNYAKAEDIMKGGEENE